MNTLELGLIGNCSIGALVDPQGEIVWSCFPRFDGDAVFCSLLQPRDAPDRHGFLAVELVDHSHAEQSYLPNSAILTTRLYDRRGGCVEITDFAPRFRQHGRMFRPTALVRRIERRAGSPRIVIRVRPSHDYGAHRPATTYGSNHIRYVGPQHVLRLTTDASITAVAEEVPFFLENCATLHLGPDETLQGSVADVGRRFQEETAAYWREWVRYLGIPFEWQDAVIRAAITLKLNAYDDTGAIIAAMTTSVPESADSGRNWDYRYCWLRDGYFVVNALNRLGATRTMERYLAYVLNVAAAAADGELQPVYRLSGAREMEEREVGSLRGYRGMGPVRVGNQAYRQIQHDVYGSTILAATHVFFDRRLLRPGDDVLFHHLERLGARALAVYDKPDAGLWELRGVTRVHAFSSLMCWAACDRLARIASHLGHRAKAQQWREAADRIHAFVCATFWDADRRSFVGSADGGPLDASLLLLHEIGFLRADDPRFLGTVRAIETELKRGDFIFRYTEEDDFGRPSNAFLVCSFWYVYALAATGRQQEARELFEVLLACRNQHGLLAEHVHPDTREPWGNFVQTYSMVGLINSAIRLSRRWDQAF